MLRRPVEWLPPFLLGMGAAVSAEIALGLLLYTSEGLMRAVTLVVMVEFAALAAGVMTRPSRPEASRTWRWMVATLALLVAGTGALAWSFPEQLPDALSSRGLMLVVFAAGPMYGFGLTLAGIQPHLRGGDGRRWPGRPRPVGAPALVGATLGVPILGLVLLPRFTPLSVYMFSLLCVATAALLESSRRERARRKYLAIPSIDEFAPDERIPSIAEFAPDP